MSIVSNPVDVAQQAVEEYKNCYGQDLISAILYGSAAGKDFNPKRSDINLLLVLSTMSLELLEKSAAIQEKWMKKQFARPLIMDKAYIVSSLDSFPIEFHSMKLCSRVLFGEDVLQSLVLHDHDMRLQAERELKGKWLHLMREWIAAKRKPAQLKRLFRHSLNDFSAIFQALLFLKEIPVPSEKRALFVAVTETFGLQKGTLEKALTAFLSGNNREMAAIFPHYSNTIKTLTDIVDQLPVKEQL